MRVILSSDRKTFTMVGNLWEGKFAIEKLDGQIRLYTRLAEKHREAATGRKFSETIKELQALRKRL